MHMYMNMNMNRKDKTVQDKTRHVVYTCEYPVYAPSCLFLLPYVFLLYLTFFPSAFLTLSSFYFCWFHGVVGYHITFT